MSETATPGVYLRLADGSLHLVHEYLGEHYELADIAENFRLGARENETTLVFDHRTLRTLKGMANAESFDHAPEFISMCLELAAVDADPQIDRLEFVSID